MQADEDLVAAACAGSKAAFADLVGRYQERLLRFLLTRSASRADAEDALQDTFINAWRYLASYDPRWRFSTWLYRIAIRAALKLRVTETTEAVDMIDPDADPLRDCIRESSRANLWLTAKGILSDDAYTAMWLRYVEDMSINDVAAALDRTPSWAKVTLKRSRDRLSGALNDQPDEPQQGGVYG